MLDKWNNLERQYNLVFNISKSGLFIVLKCFYLGINCWHTFVKVLVYSSWVGILWWEGFNQIVKVNSETSIFIWNSIIINYWKWEKCIEFHCTWSFAFINLWYWYCNYLYNILVTPAYHLQILVSSFSLVLLLIKILYLCNRSKM